MSYTIFSPNGLAQVVRAGDSQRFKIDLKNDRTAIIAAASAKALAGGISLGTFHSTTLRGKRYVSYGDYERALVLRSVARHLKRRLRIAAPDRNNAVKGVIVSLLESTPMSVIRCDIRSFYESVNTDALRDALTYDTASSARVRAYIADYFESHCGANFAGLPRGAGLSAVLAEIAIRPFDEEVEAMPGVYRYFRYADDIIVFCTADPVAILSKMGAALPKGMRFNRSKSYICDLTSPSPKKDTPPRAMKIIEYLGYQFMIEDASGKKENRKLLVRISDKKIKRLKSKIILSLHDYIRTGDHQLLLDRLRFLSGNYKIKRTGNSHSKGDDHIRSGIYYNYALCGVYKVDSKLQLIKFESSMDELKSLDGMMRSLLFSRRSEFNRYIGMFLPRPMIEQLKGLSFWRGFSDKMLMRVTPDRVRKIKGAWRNV